MLGLLLDGDDWEIAGVVGWSCWGWIGLGDDDVDGRLVLLPLAVADEDCNDAGGFDDGSEPFNKSPSVLLLARSLIITGATLF